MIEGGLIYPGVIDYISQLMDTHKALCVSISPRSTYKVLDNLLNWGVTGVQEDTVFTSGTIARDLVINSNKRFALSSH